MKVLILSGGSPKGTAFSMCQTFASKLPSSWDAEIVDVSNGVEHCRGCDRCRDGKCIIRDGMDDILDKFISADAAVFATPIRFSGPSSMIKSVIDRFQALWNNPSLLGDRKRAVTFISCGGSESPAADACTRIFRAFAVSFKCVWIDPLVVSGTDKGKYQASEVESFASSFSGSLKDIISADR